MEKKELIKGILNKEKQQQIVSEYDVAKNALDKADSIELFKLYEKAIKERGDILTTVESLCQHYAPDKPRFSASDNVIQSMERVALAAIKLAEIFITRKESK